MSKIVIRPARIAALAMFAAALLTTACRKHEAAPPEPSETNSVGTPAPLPPPLPPVPAPVVETPKPKVARAAPAPDVPADQQVIDDADATGMTSHVARDDAGNGDN